MSTPWWCQSMVTTLELFGSNSYLILLNWFIFSYCTSCRIAILFFISLQILFPILAFTWHQTQQFTESWPWIKRKYVVLSILFQFFFSKNRAHEDTSNCETELVARSAFISQRKLSDWLELNALSIVLEFMVRGTATVHIVSFAKIWERLNKFS